jgi:Na+/proline symporter
MLTLFEEGGFPMWFLLAFGVMTLVSAARFAARPESARLRLAGALGFATLFTTLTAICADLAAVGHQAPNYLSRHPELSLRTVLLQGAAESMSPAIVGFTIISLASLVVALGFYREAYTAAES